MEYAQNALSAQAQGKYAESPPVPHFEGVPALAERAEMANDRIQRFIDRFHGAPSATAGGGQLAQVPSGHIGQLQRIARTVETLERLASELDAIG